MDLKWRFRELWAVNFDKTGVQFALASTRQVPGSRRPVIYVPARHVQVVYFSGCWGCIVCRTCEIWCSRLQSLDKLKAVVFINVYFTSDYYRLFYWSSSWMLCAMGAWCVYIRNEVTLDQRWFVLILSRSSSEVKVTDQTCGHGIFFLFVYACTLRSDVCRISLYDVIYCWFVELSVLKLSVRPRVRALLCFIVEHISLTLMVRSTCVFVTFLLCSGSSGTKY